MVNKEDGPEWLKNFHNGMGLSNYAVARLKGLAQSLDNSGLEGVAQKISDQVDTLTQSLDTVYSAIDKKISDDAKESFKQTGETLRTLLEVGSQGGGDSCPSEKRSR